MNRETSILLTLVVYKLVLVLIGFWARSRNRTGADYFLGSRNLGPVVAAISASASSSSAWTLLGVSGFAYSFGLSAIWLFPACVGGFVLNWFVMARPLRRLSRETGALTITEMLAGPVGAPLHRTLRVLGSTIVLVFLTAYVASQFQAAGKAFHETFGVSVETSIVIGASVVMLYTLLGGFWAVSLTDTLQGLVMALTAVVLPLAALVAVGGPSALLVELRNIPQFLELDQGLPPMIAVGFVAGLLGIGLGYPGQPHVVNRLMALRPGELSLVHARRIAIGWAVLVYSGMILLGLCGRVLFSSLGDHEAVFFAATAELFHPVLAGFLLATVLSAIMSTADSQLLVAASAVTNDLGYGGDSVGSMVRRSRLVVAVLSVLAVIAALFGPREIFSPVLIAWSALGAAFGPLLLATVLRRRPVSPMRTLAAMSSGLVLVIAGATYRSLTAAPADAVWERIVPFVVAGLIAFGPYRRRSLFSKPTQE